MEKIMEQLNGEQLKRIITALENYVEYYKESANNYRMWYTEKSYTNKAIIFDESEWVVFLI